MTIPPVIRIFFAIDLPADVRLQISQYIQQLKKRAKSNGIRWTKPENLHVTLQFLPEVQTEHLPILLKNVQEKVTGAVNASKIHFGKLQLFPNPFRPRVIVLDVTPQEELANLSAIIGAGVKASAYETENRPFRAHLTLGRIKNPQATKLDFISEIGEPVLEDLSVDDIALFRSEPQPEGSVYTVIERIKFAS